MIDKVLKILFGWHQYRVKFIYKNKTGAVVFSYTQTVGVVSKSLINAHRKIKSEIGPVSNISGVQKRLLSNGVIMVEPVCYLGRWH